MVHGPFLYLFQARLLSSVVLIAIELVVVVLLLVFLEQRFHGCVDVEVVLAHIARHVLDILDVSSIILLI